MARKAQLELDKGMEGRHGQEKVVFTIGMQTVLILTMV